MHPLRVYLSWPVKKLPLCWDRVMSIQSKITAELESSLDPGFSGVVSVSIGDSVIVENPYGYADRTHGVAVTTDTRFTRFYC